MQQQCQFRVLLEARLCPGALSHTPPPPRRPASSSDPSTRAATPLPSPVLGVQHRLALTYALPSGEQQASSLLASALPPARPESAAAESANMQPAADSRAEAPAGIDGAALRPNVLQWKAEHIIAVDEALVRSWAGSHAALPIALKAASRTQLPPPAEAAADAADAAAGQSVAKPAAKAGGKALAGDTAQDEGMELWGTDSSWAGSLDCAGLLLGDSKAALQIPVRGGVVPPELVAFESVTVAVEVWTLPAALPELSPAEAKAAAAKAKADPKAAAAAQEAALAALPPQQKCKLLPDELAGKLCPLVITPVKASRLPSSPATTQQLDTQCHPVSLSLRIPLQGSQISLPAQVLPWQQAGNFAVRKVRFSGSVVVLAADLDMDELLLAVQESTMAVESAKSLTPDKPPAAGKPGKPGTAAAAAQSPPPKQDVQLQAEQQPPEPAPQAAAAAEYVCGVAKCNLASLAKGYRRVECVAALAPLTAVRGAAGLDWRTRPGRYMEAESTLKVVVRTAVPLTDALAAQQQAALRPYGRAVFCMAYADTEMLHLVEGTMRRLNAGVLGLDRTPGELARQKAAAAAAAAAAAVAEAEAESRSAEGASSQRSQRSRRLASASSRPASTGAGTAAGKANVAGSSATTEPWGAPGLSVQVLQALSTYKLSDEQAADPELDVLTGFQLVDGQERMIVVEGLADKAMKVMAQLATKLLQDKASRAEAAQSVAERYGQRRVLLNQAARYKRRLFAAFGPSLWIIKLRASLTTIEGQASSFAAGKVRPECVEGLKRVLGLRRVAWARQVDSMMLMPTSAQMGLIDKRFGGALSKEDVLGMVPEPLVQFDKAAVGGGTRNTRRSLSRAGTSRASTARSGSIQGSTSVGGSTQGGTMSMAATCAAQSIAATQHPADLQSENSTEGGRTGAEPVVECWNDEFLVAKAHADALRGRENWLAHNRDAVRQLERGWPGKITSSIRGAASTEHSHLREQWAAWNPQRAAAQDLQHRIEAGEVSYEDTVQAAVQHKGEVLPGTVSPQEATRRGWYAHSGPFKWPAPKAAQMFNQHPKRPSQARIDDLAEPWTDSYSPQAPEEFAAPFQSIAVASSLFTKDPEYWKSVHLVGQGLARERQEAKQRELDAWKAKVVVADTCFHSTLPRRRKPSQMDTVQPILHDPPAKLGFKISQAPKAPYSIFLGEPYRDGSKPKPPPGKEANKHLLSQGMPQSDFHRFIKSFHSSVYNPALAHGSQIYQPGIGLNFHFDKDEHCMKERHEMLHPELSSILYLTGSENPEQQLGPTVILDQLFDIEHGPVPDNPTGCVLAWPAANRYCIFDGRLGHGEINLMSGEEQGQLRPVADSCQPTSKPSQSRIPALRVQPGTTPLLVDDLCAAVWPGKAAAHSLRLDHPGYELFPLDEDSFQQEDGMLQTAAALVPAEDSSASDDE
eukprot:jgi/Astpho2/7094/Aster-x1406